MAGEIDQISAAIGRLEQGQDRLAKDVHAILVKLEGFPAVRAVAYSTQKEVKSLSEWRQRVNGAAKFAGVIAAGIGTVGGLLFSLFDLSSVTKFFK